MKAVIMQPTYLPWSGYFDLMDQGDIFVILDNVQFSKHSWHQKNRIKTPNGELMLTVPIIRRHPQMINETRINNDQPWQKKHLKSIQASYAKAKYFNRYYNFFREIYSQSTEKLIDFTIPIIMLEKEILGIKREVVKASEIGVEGSKVELIVDICKKVNADEYLSPPGSEEYINEVISKNDVFKKNNIKLEYQKYIPQEYTQLWGEFIPYLSAIDLIFNEGENALPIIRSGRKK